VLVSDDYMRPRLESFQPPPVIMADAPLTFDQAAYRAFQCISGNLAPRPSENLPMILLSNEYSKSMTGVLGHSFVEDFRKFLNASALTHIESNKLPLCGLSAQDMQQLSHMAGYRLLSQLDHVLHRTYLAANSSHELLQSLFLAITAILLAVQYSNKPISYTSRAFESVDGAVMDLWSSMKEHVERMLRHYAVLFARRLDSSLQEDIWHQMLASPPPLHRDTSVSHANGLWGFPLKSFWGFQAEHSSSDPLEVTEPVPDASLPTTNSLIVEVPNFTSSMEEIYSIAADRIMNGEEFKIVGWTSLNSFKVIEQYSYDDYAWGVC
jgi:hypothetical protein